MPKSFCSLYLTFAFFSNGILKYLLTFGSKRETKNDEFLSSELKSSRKRWPFIPPELITVILEIDIVDCPDLGHMFSPRVDRKMSALPGHTLPVRLG